MLTPLCFRDYVAIICLVICPIVNSMKTDRERSPVADISSNTACSCKYGVEGNRLGAYDEKKLLRVGDKIAAGSTVTFFCYFPGFLRFQGQHTATCSPNCSWNIEKPPFCSVPKDDDLIIKVFPYPTNNVIVGPNETVSVTPGAEIELLCRVGPGYGASLLWDVPQSSNGTHKEVFNSNTGSYKITYLLHEVTSQDAGEYRCSDDDGRSHRIFIGVRDKEPEVALTSPAPEKTSTLPLELDPAGISPGREEILVVPGESVELPCKAYGNPTPTVTWKKHGDLLSIDDPRYERSPNNSLLIHSVTPEDDDYYLCEAHNGIGTGAKFRVRLIVAQLVSCGLPRDRGPCENYKIKWFFDVIYGYCSRFWYGGCGGNGNVFPTQEDCEAVCVHPPGKGACLLPLVVGSCVEKIPSWYYDGNSQSCERFTYSGCSGNSNRFTSKEICMQTCMEYSTIGTPETTAGTSPQPKGTPETTAGTSPQPGVPARINPGQNNFHKLYGETAELSCFATGNPSPKVTWKKNNTLLDMNDPHYTLLTNYSLRIHSVTLKDEDDYLCEANNGIGQTAEFPVRLLVGKLG